MNLSELDRIVGHQGGLNRRLFMAYAATLTSIPFINTACAVQNIKFDKNPFSLGVASGDPDHEGMVLWTRLAPEPLELDGGMPLAASVEVKWEIASDQEMKSIIKSDTEVASPELGHTIHIEVEGLKPDRWYWYRFHCGGYTSPVGRTRTMPLPDSMPEKLRFVATSCQHYEQGLYTAYEQMIADDVDLVFHLGDYIYEYAGNTKRIRTHIGPEIENVAQYRQRYSQYRTDPLLQKMHAQCPWILTWDDHEFDNNCAGDISEQKNVDKVKFLQRRAAAYQVYYEMMPLRKSCVPNGPHMQLYRQSAYGRLADFLVLDTRQFRTDQPNGDGNKPLNDQALNPNNTLLGKDQKAWMYKSLAKSDATWNVLAQQVMMGMVNREHNTEKEARYSMDQWPGYAAEKMDIMRYLSNRKISNPVVLTGDIHSNWVNELRIDDFKAETPLVATEFVATSLSSGGNGGEAIKSAESYKSKNACVKFYNAQRGYILCEVTPKQWVSHYKTVDQVMKPGGKTSTKASFAVNAGNPKVYQM